MKKRYFAKLTPTCPPVIESLQKKGVLIKEDGVRAFFKCPACGAIATYESPSEIFPYGNVQCSCDFDLTALLESLGLQRHNVRMCPKINVTKVPIHELAEVAEEILAETSKIVTCGQTLYIADYTTGRLSSLEEADLVRILSTHCVMVRYDARTKQEEPIDPPAKLVRLLLGSQQRTMVPEVLGVIRQPFVRSDGSLCMTPGYIPDLKVLAAFDPTKFAPYAWEGHVSRSGVEKALEICEDLYCEFYPADASMKSAMIGAGLLAVQRGVIERAPMVLVQGNAPGSGKSTLAKVYARLATPENIAESSYPETAEEAAKQLLSALTMAPGAVFFDNIEGVMPAYPAMCTCLTEPLYERRVLQRSTLRQVITRTFFVGTGNFITPQADLRRRVFPVKLLAESENPEQRSFERDIESYLEAKRSEIVMAHLKLVAGYLQSGEKAKVRTLAGMSAFTQRCREPLAWMGRPDPAEPMLKILDEGDDDLAKRYEFLRRLQKLFGDETISVSAIARQSDSELLDILADLNVMPNGRLARESLGWLLRGLAGFPVRNLEIVRLGKPSHYRIRELK